MSQLTLNKVVTPSPNPAVGKGAFYFSSTLSPAAPAFIDESGNICRIGGLATKDYRRVRVVQHITGDTSHTPSSGVSAIYAYGVGAGGSGAGCAATSATTCEVKPGGGGGAFAAVWLTTAVAGAMTIAVGDGGGASGASASDGVVGGDTSLTDTGSVQRLLAKGGGPGLTANGVLVGVGSGTSILAGANNGRGGTGGAASSCVGDTKIDGGMGGSPLRLSGVSGKAGNGGNPAGRSAGQLEGPSLAAAGSSTGTTVPTTQYGAGSTGTINISVSGVASLKAAPGVLIIEEYA